MVFVSSFWYMSIKWVNGTDNVDTEHKHRGIIMSQMRWTGHSV